MKSYRNVILAESPRRYWRLGSGAIPEETGLGTAGTYTGTTTFVTGPINREPSLAATFAGSSQFNGDTLGSVLAAGSVECWIKTTTTSLGAAWGTVNTGNNGVLLRVNQTSGGTTTSGYVRVIVVANDGKLLAAASSTPTTINNGEWRHLAASWTCSTNTVSIWLDGVALSLSYSHQQTPASFVALSQNFMVGAYNAAGTATQRMSGSFAEVAAYDRVLTTAQAQHHYLAGVNGVSYPEGSI